MISKKFPVFFPIFQNDLNFFLLFSLLVALIPTLHRRRRRLIQFNATIKPFVTTVYDLAFARALTTQTRNYIMEKSILLRKQWLIRSHGKWIWRWKICTRATLHRTCARARMRWERQKLVCDCKVSLFVHRRDYTFASADDDASWERVEQSCSFEKFFFYILKLKSFLCGWKSAKVGWCCLWNLIICIWDLRFLSQGNSQLFLSCKWHSKTSRVAEKTQIDVLAGWII